MDKEKFIKQYKKLKDLNKGRKPLYKDFLKFCGIDKRKLYEVFGKNAYSKLQEECGDNTNRLLMARTPINQILNQYGELVRKSNSLPVGADWMQAKLKPSANDK
jgi:arginine deiminase